MHTLKFKVNNFITSIMKCLRNTCSTSTVTFSLIFFKLLTYIPHNFLKLYFLKFSSKVRKNVGKRYNYVVKSRVEEWGKYKWWSQSSRSNIRLTNGQNDSFPNCTPLSHTHLQLHLQRCAVSIPRPCQYQRSHLYPFDHKWAFSPLNKNTLPSRATSRGISVINSLCES